MRRLLLFAILALPAWPNACTLANPPDFAPHNMTSDTAPSPYVASQSTSYFTAGASALFNGVGDWIGTNGGTDWIALDWGSGNSNALYGYQIQINTVAGAARRPKNWTMQGSNNGSTWITLDTQTNQTSWPGAGKNTYALSSQSAAYRYYKWNITANNGDASYTQVTQLYFWSTAVPTGAYTTLASTAGHWTGAGCTGGSYIPAAGSSAGTGDTITVPYGYKLTIDHSYAIGANNANNGACAITVGESAGYSGQVEVSAGATLTLRGDFCPTSGAAASSYPMTMDAGSALVFDASLSASPSTTRYKWGAAGAWVAFIANGTAGAHVVVTSCAAGNTAYCASPGTPGLPAQFRDGNVGAAPSNGVYLQVAYTDFSYLGDAAANGEFLSPMAGSGGNISIVDSTFNRVGPWYSGGPTTGSTSSLLIDRNIWTNSPGTNNIWAGLYTPATGTYAVTNNAFDITWNSGYGSRTPGGGCNGALSFPGSVTLTGNVFLGGYCLGGTSEATSEQSFSDNFISAGCYNEISYPTYTPSQLYIYCYQDQDNPHVSGPPTWMQTLTNSVFDSMSPTYATSEGKAYHSGGSAGVTASLLNSVLLPNRNNYGSLTTSDHTPSYSANIQVTNHNAGISDSGMNIDEGGATNVRVSSFKSNAFVSPIVSGAPGAGFLIQNKGSSPNTLDLCNSSTACDYNSMWPLNLTTCSGCAGAQNGYNTRMDYWPNYTGTHDLSTANVPTFYGPYFADPSRRLATADTLLFHNVASRGAWAAAAAYAVADSALVNHSPSVYYGSPVNYYCINAHTATSFNEPEEGTYTSANGGLLSLVVSGGVATAVLAENSQLAVGSVVNSGGTFAGTIFHANVVVTGVSTTNVANDTITYPLAVSNGTYTSAAAITTWMAFWKHNALVTLASYVSSGTTFLDGAVPGCQTTACAPVPYLIDWVLRGYTPQNPALWCAGHDGEAIGAVPFCASGKLLLGTLAGM
jgi:hypothetical protein